MVGTARRDQCLLRLDLVCEASGGRGKRLGCVYIYIYIIYTPNLGLGVALFDREKEQGSFRGSREGARGRTPQEHRGSNKGAAREQEAQQRSKGSGSLY